MTSIKKIITPKYERRQIVKRQIKDAKGKGRKVYKLAEVELDKDGKIKTGLVLGRRGEIKPLEELKKRRKKDKADAFIEYSSEKVGPSIRKKK